ncbi:hypothetical protein CMA01_25380 [Carnobacterium maltaromaticum]|nr:hypothetical protein CMA01_25380 [Carnobacterium maltaromaticum]
MATKNKATRYSKEFRESVISLSQTGRSVNSPSKEYNVRTPMSSFKTIMPIFHKHTLHFIGYRDE